MNNQKAWKSLPSRPLGLRRFLWAVGTTSLLQAGICSAEDGIRELRNPAEMANVPPVRAIGIRLTPAVPFDPDASVPQPQPIESLSRSPERIVPKPKVIARSTDTTAHQPIRIHPQAPIRFSLNRNTIVTDSVAVEAVPPPPTDSLPRAPEAVKSSLVANAVATDRAPSVHPAVSMDMEMDRDRDRERTESLEPETPTPPSIPKLDAVVPMSLPLVPLVVDAPPIVAAPSMLIQPDASTPVADMGWAVAKDALVLDLIQDAEARLDIASQPTRVSYTEEQLSQAVSVELETQNAREIQVDIPIQSIMVSDEKICRAMARDGRIYLVGLQAGEAWIEIQPFDGNPSRLLKAKVVMPWQRAHGVTDLDALLYTIQPLCPNGTLTIQPQADGSVVVKGKVDSQESAKRIMELTRKLILAPVVDKLEIR